MAIEIAAVYGTLNVPEPYGFGLVEPDQALCTEKPERI
jgi:hypothetical protein